MMLANNLNDFSTNAENNIPRTSSASKKKGGKINRITVDAVPPLQVKAKKTLSLVTKANN